MRKLDRGFHRDQETIRSVLADQIWIDFVAAWDKVMNLDRFDLV